MAAMNAKDNPATPSLDHAAMKPGWDMIADILEGAAKVREAGEKYLPRFQKEKITAYKRRLKCAPWRPVFENALNTISAKPFSKPVEVGPDSPEEILGKVVDEKTKLRKGGFADDVDGQGNDLHVFARTGFRAGVGFGISGIYVAFPTSETPARTKAEEKALNLRPYWVHVRGPDILDVRFTLKGGRAVVSMVRMRENTTEPDGFAEKLVERIRVVELENDVPKWTLWRKREQAAGVTGEEWSIEAQGQLIGVKGIPLALFLTSPRMGNFRVKPPMLDLADMQIELYREMARADQIKELAGFPMLVGEGLSPPDPAAAMDDEGNLDGVPMPEQDVGPGVILYAPPSMDGKPATWKYIQPDASSLTELREGVGEVIKDFKELAMQPSTPRSGDMVATTSAIDAAKAHSAISAWARQYKDVLEQAFTFTAQWMEIEETITVHINTDFDVGALGGQETTALSSAEARKVISKRTERAELKRRNILSPDVDDEAEEAQIAEEMQGLEGEEAIDPITGKPIKPAPADDPEDDDPPKDPAE